MKTNSLALESLIQGFRLSCQAEGKSPRTVEWYTGFLLRFLRFLNSNGLPTALDEITRGGHQGIYTLPADGSQDTT